MISRRATKLLHKEVQEICLSSFKPMGDGFWRKWNHFVVTRSNNCHWWFSAQWLVGCFSWHISRTVIKLKDKSIWIFVCQVLLLGFPCICSRHSYTVCWILPLFRPVFLWASWGWGFAIHDPWEIMRTTEYSTVTGEYVPLCTHTRIMA